MMKNINKYILASSLALGAVFTSCEEEVLVPVEDNTEINALLEKISTLESQLYEVNLEKRTVTIQNNELANKLDSIRDVRNELNSLRWNDRETEVQYTVNVISAANYVQGRAAGLGGATVTVRQGEYVETQETAGGLALFKGMKQGQASVTVSAPDHGTVEMSVDFLSDGTYSDDAEYYNAGTQVLLFPIAGKNAATVKGSLYANTTTINDTLARYYSDAPEFFGEKAGTYVAEPGIYFSSNFTQSSENDKVRGNIYFDNVYYSNSPSGASIKFEAVPSSFDLYAIAKPSKGHQFDIGSDAGYIRSITYNDMVFKATINDDNSYEVLVPASMGDNLSIDFETSEVIAEHTRFTAPEWKSIGVDQDGDGIIDYYDDYYVMGGAEELGSEKESFTYYNSEDYTKELYSLNGDGSVVTINPNSSGDVVRRIITETYKYEGYWMSTHRFGYETMLPIESNNAVDFDFEPGEVAFQNIYLFPIEEGKESNI
jgi:hypothetical protein